MPPKNGEAARSDQDRNRLDAVRQGELEKDSAGACCEQRAAGHVDLVLPYAPSANRLWRSVAGRQIKSKQYRAWLALCLAEIRLQRPGFIAGRYRMTLVATAPDRRRRDVENLLKPVSDALVQAGVVEDDSLARKVSAEWSDLPPLFPGRLEVTVEGCP